MVALNTLPLAAQEQLILEDLLYLMLAIEGRYIKVSVTTKMVDNHEEDTVLFQVDPTLDSSHYILVNRVLPLCEHYIRVTRFIERHYRYEYGTVFHALCAAINSFLKVIEFWLSLMMTFV
jgi:gamma-tubulin complex component 2